MNFFKTYKEQLLLMIGHFATDICQGSLSAILAVMFAHKILSSNTDVSLLVLAACLVSSIVQPVVGWLSDRKPRPYLMTLGMVISAFSLMLVGFFEKFEILFVLITLSGIGTAIFHPQAGKMANCVSEHNKGFGMSIFSVGGNLGFAIGPALISGATLLYGLKGILAIGIPAFIMMIIYLSRNKKYVYFSERDLAKQQANKLYKKESFFGFSLLTVMIFFRSSVLIGLTTYTPLYFMDKFKETAQVANINLTIIAICAAVASILGGILADKIGFKKVLALSATTAVPFIFVFCLANTSLLATILVVPVAICLYGTLSVSMVLGQKFLCNHVGFASGVTIGLGMTFGGLFSPVLGIIGDRYGIEATMWTLAILSIFAALSSWIVPDVDKDNK
ncbi:MAG: MFS transporter [Succinivibrionaceae bacterium]